MKRGISTIIATLLLILLVITIAVGIYIWMQTTLFKSEAQGTKDQACSQVRFNTADFCYEIVGVPNINTGVTENKERLVFNAVNDAPTTIEGFSISIDYNTGVNFPLATLPGTELNQNDIKKLTTDFINNPANIKQIEVSPDIQLNNETIACDENPMVFDWSQITSC